MITRARDPHALGQALEALASAAAHAIVGDDLGDLPPLALGILGDPGALVLERDRAGPGFLRSANVADGGHHHDSPNAARRDPAVLVGALARVDGGDHRGTSGIPCGIHGNCIRRKLHRSCRFSQTVSSPFLIAHSVTTLCHRPLAC